MTTHYRVLFHLPDADPTRHAQVMRNAENTFNDFATGEIELEIVANAGGIWAFTTTRTTVAEKLADLVKRGVRLAACANTMQANQITQADLLPDVRIVSSGIGELIRKQAEGWLYIRP